MQSEHRQPTSRPTVWLAGWLVGWLARYYYYYMIDCGVLLVLPKRALWTTSQPASEETRRQAKKQAQSIKVKTFQDMMHSNLVSKARSFLRSSSIGNCLLAFGFSKYNFIRHKPSSAELSWADKESSLSRSNYSSSSSLPTFVSLSISISPRCSYWLPRRDLGSQVCTWSDLEVEMNSFL